MIFTLKSWILINFVKKKSHRGGGPTGGHLRWWACLRRPAARVLNCTENTCISAKHFTVLNDFSMTITSQSQLTHNLDSVSSQSFSVNMWNRITNAQTMIMQTDPEQIIHMISPDPFRTHMLTIQNMSGPVRTHSGPVRTNSGPVRTNSGPVRTNSVSYFKEENS